MISTRESAAHGQEATAAERSEFERELAAARKREERFDTGRVVWAPQPGAQRDFLQCPVFECLLHGPRGGGKMQPHESLVRTRMGWSRMGDIKVGDMVMTPRGSLVPVTHVFDHKDRPIYRVTMADGGSTLAGDEHLWKFKAVGYGRKAHNGSDWHVHDTMEMRRRLEKGQAVLIPTVDPLPFRMPGRLQDYPVDPYFMGLWIGDGDSRWSNRIIRVGMTAKDPEIIEFIKTLGFIGGEEYAPLQWRLNKSDDAHGIYRGLAGLGLGPTRCETKFIPHCYKDGPIDVRLAVLQGLMDTDGTCGTDGHSSFTSVSEQLAKDVQYIARSLGAKATLSRGPSYLGETRHLDHFDVYIQPAGKFMPFRLKRKAERVKPYMHKELCRRVRSIEFVGTMDARCILLDDLDHLYVTDDFIVTHNSDALLMSFLQHVGRGFGRFWSGYIFRQTYPQLADIVARSERWIPRIFPGSRLNAQKLTWTFREGECLSFRYGRRPEDYWNYHGHERPFLGFEELTNWPDARFYLRMHSICRSSHPGVPRMVRGNTNSYGVGMQWLRDRFGLAGGKWRLPVYIEATKDEQARAAIHVHTDENRALLEADPHYKQNVIAACDNDAMLSAWLEGSWDIVAGGMFSDVWRPEWNELPRGEIPASWRIDRSFDWGSSKPFSVDWWAESDGTGRLPGGRPTVRGDLVRIREWYGWNGRPNEGLRMLAVDVAKGIVEREMAWGLRNVQPGPADSSIMDVENGVSIALDMAKPVPIGGRMYPGVQWTAADKRPGSRKAGWEKVRQMMRGAHGVVREQPGLFVVRDDSPQFLRTMLALPRDEKDMDDVDTDAEEHIADSVRYRARASGTSVSFSGRVVGGW